MCAAEAWHLFDPATLLADPGAHEKCGGKGRSLLQLHDWGMPVPPFLILPSDNVAAWLGVLRERIADCLASTDLDDPEQCTAAAGAIRAWIAAHDVDEESAKETLDRCRAYFGSGYRCAVRSSATAEDGEKDSFAGQLDSYLHVGEADLLDRIRACIGSVYSARALHYRHRRGLSASDEGIAVIVQKMVPAARAGVLFSMNVGGNLNEIAVAAAYGLGEGVVAGQAESDHYFITRDHHRIYRRISQKETRLDPDPGGDWGLRANPVAADMRNAPVLDDAELRDLAELAMDLEERQGSAQDLEFAFDQDGALHLLQSRPITTLGDNLAQDLIILDNANIVESYPGVTLPLSFDFARLAYRHVFGAAARAFGISEAWILDHGPVFEHLLGHLNGRVYYRLDNARQVTSQVLTSVASQRGWQAFLGLSSLPWPITRPSLGARLKSARNMVRLALGYRSKNRDLEAKIEAELRDLRSFVTDIEKRGSREIWEHFETRSRHLFEAWAPTIVNDYFTMKTHDLLNRQISKLPGTDAALVNDLLCGIEGLASEGPYLALMALKQRILSDPSLTVLFKRPATEIAGRMTRNAASVSDEFRRAWNDYLREFGDRTLEELKLESPNLRMRPDLLASMLQNQLSNPQDSDVTDARKRTNRDAAESRLQDALRGHPIRRRVVTKLLAMARQAVRDREAMRINRARAYGTVKEMFHELGRRMHLRGLLTAPEDVFYLRLTELRAFAKDDAASDLRDLVATRRREAEIQSGYEMPDRLSYAKGQTPGLQHYAKAENASHLSSGTSEYSVRQGLGVSRGVVDGEALVLDAPSLTQRIAGQVLVTRMTDPGWVFLMVQASAIVSEKGSLLSHTAIIGRELGIPTVVGLEGATEWLRDGAQVRLDGGTGTVEKLAVKERLRDKAS